MGKLKDFSYKSATEIEAAIKGKVICGFEITEDMRDWIIIKFTDGSDFRLRYDWIYEWMASPSPGKN